MRRKLTDRCARPILHGRRNNQNGRTANTLPLRLESLEPRYLLSGVDGVGPLPDATDNHYLTHDVAPVSRNMVTDDTGKGVDTSGNGEQPLIVTEINGQRFEPDAPIVLASGASLAVNADGGFVYDPTTSPTLGAMPPGAPAETDSFTYTVSAGPTDIIVFGDSLSDVGNLYNITYGAIPPYPYWQGHFSNGPVWVEQMAPRLNVSSTLENNYAVGGAGTGQNNINQPRVPTEMDLPGLQDEIDSFIDNLDGPADADALYVVWSGPNDFFGEITDVNLAIYEAVGNIVTAVTALEGAGAEHIMVPNMVNLGLTPFGTSSGMADDLTQLSFGFNVLLGATIDILELDVIEIDAFPILNAIVNDPGSYGFTNVTDMCFDGASICGDPDEYLFWDSVHPTTKGHEIIADMMFEQLMASEPFVHSDTATVKVSVSDPTTPVAIVDDNLYVGGTSASDRIFVSSDPSGKVRVLVNYAHMGSYDLDPAARVIVIGHDGHDLIYASQLSRSTILEGGAGRDFLFGGSAADILRGGGGTDFLYGNAGSDSLSGDGGDDFLFGGWGDDALYGGDGSDYLFGGQGNDILYGNAGNDRLFGQLGDDYLDGGDDDDWLFGGLGSDVLLNGERNFE